MLTNIPQELLFSSNSPEDVNIVIGENGSGKSSLLYYLAKYHTTRGQDVIGIAHTIHDKFDIYNSKFYALKDRRGRRQTVQTVKDALKIISKNNEQGLRNVSRALKYVGYDPRIGFTVKRIHSKFERIIKETELIENSEKDVINSLLNKFYNEYRYKSSIWIEMNGYTFKDVNLSSLTKLFHYESILKKLKIINSMDVFLSKDNNSIPLFQASSGELSLITLIIYLSSVIKERKTVILIDEPENSLHPKWQKEYFKILLDVFHYYHPKFVVATHSPIIVNGAELFTSKPSIYKANNFNFILYDNELKNIEETFFKLFGVSTPENRFLSNYIVKLLNKLSNKEMSYEIFLGRVEEIQESIYDKRQKAVMNRVIEIANKIVDR